MFYTKRSIVILFCVTILNPGYSQVFMDVANSYGIADDRPSWAAAWLDYDDDGDIDILVGTYYMPTLFRNDGDLFVDVAETVGFEETGIWTTDLSFGDYDNDGDIDVILPIDGGCTLYRNDINETSSFTLVETFLNGKGSFVDYDNDGDLDIYLRSFNYPNNLYRNDEGVFTEISGALGLNDPRHSRSAVWGDYDADGDMDVYVVNGAYDESALYRNDVLITGNFTDVTYEMGVQNEWTYGTAACWGDYDNDGDLDLYVVNHDYGQPNRLYRNDVNTTGAFTEVASSLGIAGEDKGMAASWSDYDNDGDLDLYVINVENLPNRLYRNDISQGEGFTDTGEMADLQLGTGGSWGDFDGDGDIDFYLVGGNQGNLMVNRLYQNSGNNNHWLHIETVGIISNRSGIGTKIRVVAGKLDQIRYVESSSGHGSQNSLPVEFGLGEAEQVDSIIVYWPSGIVQVLTEETINKRMFIVENSTLNIAVSPSDSLDFGGVFVEDDTTRIVRIRNVSSDTLEIYDINSNSPDFTILNVLGDTLVLQPGERYKIDIVFSPDSIGNYEGELTITSNDPDESVYTIFLLGKGVLAPVISVEPDSVTETLLSGETSMHYLTIRNLQGIGGIDLEFTVSVENAEGPTGMLDVSRLNNSRSGYIPVEKNRKNRISHHKINNLHEPTTKEKRGLIDSNNKTTHQDDRIAITRHLISLDKKSNIGDILISFPIPYPISFGWGIGYEPQEDLLWISDAYNPGDHKVSLDGNYIVPIPLTWVGEWPADIATDGDYIYQVNVGGNNGIYKMDLEGNTIKFLIGPWYWSQRGLAIDPVTGDLYVGGWNDEGIYQIKGFESDNPGELISFIDFSGTELRSISGLAWHEGTRTLWVTVNSYDEIIAEVDPITGEILQWFDFPDSYGYSGAGLDIDKKGNFWVVNQTNHTIYQLEGIPLLKFVTISPNSGSISPGESIELTLLFDATDLLMGNYLADIVILSNDPEKSEIDIPVKLSVTDLSVDGELLLPTDLILHQNYPNPFNSSTVILYDLPEMIPVSLTIYDLLGRRVVSLVDEIQTAGHKSIVWDSTNNKGEMVGSGIYLYRLKTTNNKKTGKMLLLR